MASVVFIVGVTVSIIGLRANHTVAAQVNYLQQRTAKAHSNANTTPAASTDTVPVTTPPSSQDVANYTVSPTMPRYIDIPSLSIHARILPEGVSSSNQLQVPWNIYDVGWYKASAQPGQTGAMLVDGHSGINGLHGVFYKLGSVANNSPIIITRGDGTKYTYTVVKVQTVNVAKVDMQSMVVAANAGKGLNLITCAGDQIPGTDELNQRVQVYAVIQ